MSRLTGSNCGSKFLSAAINARSCRGDRPNLRAYTRENWAELSYPLSKTILGTFQCYCARHRAHATGAGPFDTEGASYS
jgi:hypothetical protein